MHDREAPLDTDRIWINTRVDVQILVNLIFLDIIFLIFYNSSCDVDRLKQIDRLQIYKNYFWIIFWSF